MVNVEALLRTSLADRYDVEDEIGHGGMSVVFRAHDIKHNRTVAIKVLRPELSRQIGAERFQREIEVVAGLTHPHILPLHDSGEADGLLFYVMPFVEEGSLRARIEADGTLPEADALRITREISDALGHAHRHGVVHRDVKPGNILLSGDHALLADFGVAHLASGVQETLTEAGIALGTPAYLSPEQASGEEIDGRSDIYSLGCVLYHTLTGSPPFSGDSVRAMLVHQMVDTPPSVRSLNERISPAAEAIVETAIRKDPDERFQSAEQMGGALATVGAGIWGLPALLFRRLGLPHRQANRAAIAAAAIGFTLAVSLTYLVWRDMQHPDPRLARTEVRYLVQASWTDDATSEEVALSKRAARHLRDRLEGWPSVSVVPEVAMQGPTADLLTAGLTQSSFALGASLTERFDADFQVQVEGRIAGAPESAPSSRLTNIVQITASAFDARGDEPFENLPAEGPVDSLGELMTGIAMRLLALEGQVADWELLQARSTDHRAIAQFDSARDALLAWRLAEARRLLEAAILRDTTFALAHHLLSETMYWEVARDDERLYELGPRIELHSRQAARFAERRLRPSERAAVDAFRAFWRGDYDDARVRYDELIEREPADLESLVLRGAVEVEDPIVRETEAGQLLPRSSLNVARRMFDTATALNPEWELSWGHLHEIDLQILEAAYFRHRGQGFELPGSELVTPYEKREAVDQLYFCPVVEPDSIVWRRLDANGCPVDSASLDAAKQLHARTVKRLDWMTEVNRDRQPRHHEELATFLLWERSVPGCDADPIRADSLLAAARKHFDRALHIRRDRGDPLTPQQLVRIANFELGRGDYDGALDAARQALEELPGWDSPDVTPPPTAAVNPFLANGEATLAARIAEGIWGENSVSLPDPHDPDRDIDAQSQYGRLRALQALGTAGVSGPEVVDRLARLQRAWRTDSLPERDRIALRSSSLTLVGPALVHAPEVWEDWFSEWDKYRLEVPPVWKGLLTAEADPPDLPEAHTHLDASVAALSQGPQGARVRPVDLYLPIVLARRIGAADVEAELQNRLLRCPLRLDGFEVGWGEVYSLGLID